MLGHKCNANLSRYQVWRETQAFVTLLGILKDSFI
jgi:hypothetical protein